MLTNNYATLFTPYLVRLMALFIANVSKHVVSNYNPFIPIDFKQMDCGHARV